MIPGSTPDDLKVEGGARSALVEAARQIWIRRLMDTTRRNNLLYFRELKTGTLDLGGADAETLEALLRGERLSLARLVPAEIDERAATRLREITRKARSNLEEKGLQTLFLAYGMATWPASDGGRDPEAAVLLLPIAVEAKRTEASTMYVQRAGTAQVNIALLHALSEEFNIHASADQILAQPNEADEGFAGNDSLRNVQQIASGVKGFAVTNRTVIGNFSFQKLAMVKDLKEGGEALEQHPIVAALAGDMEARNVIASRRVSVDPCTLDTIPATSEYIVLDADSSQQAVVHAVARDSDGVVQGPPGCGKSQTIANTIATLVAHGKRVLFVAEKRAALEAVYKRLQGVGLGHLALDLHGAAVSQKSVMEAVARALDAIHYAVEPNDEAQHSRFEDRRAKVVAHAMRMDKPLEPSGLTPFQLQSGILQTARDAVAKTRWRGAELKGLTGATAEKVVDLLKEGAAYGDLLSRKGASPWKDAEINDGEAAQETFDAAVRLSSEDLPQLEEQLRDLSERSGLPVPVSIAEAQALITIICEVNEFLADHQEMVFSRAAELRIALQPAAKGLFQLLCATLFNPSFRRAKREVVGLRKGRRASTRELLADIALADDIRDRRASLGSGAMPKYVPVGSEVSTALSRVRSDLDKLTAALPSIGLASIDQIRELGHDLSHDEVSAIAIPKVRQIEEGLREAGVEAILVEIRSTEVQPVHWQALFLNAWYSSCYEAARAKMPELAAFTGASHSGLVSEFCDLDRTRLNLAVHRIKRAHAKLAIAARNDFPEEEALVSREAKKRSRHLPLRKLVAQAPNVLTAVCPCWMSSPLNVSQLIPADQQYFDVVIFDEASQVPPEDAICSVLRGQRLVVSGDRHQLPPTIFFADGAQEEDEEEATSGFESLLDQMSSFVTPWPLEWHYRSRDERLIAFSNRHIYSDSLTTFPGVGGAMVVSHILVDSLPRDGEEESSSAEVDRVVGLVLEHAEERPNERLGVITMGIKHAIRIQAALDRALDSRRNPEEFFDPNNEERFFIKNLEQVQGDERDAIILSVGYGKDHNGRLLYRFGPLNNMGGERRLNVAVSRARRRMTVVSSFSHLDMDPGRSDKRGVELLRLYLQFAASFGANVGEDGARDVALNPFEADVRDALTARGIPLVPQFGVSNYRLDFAAQHPEKPGLSVLAIECDGRAYHSGLTARDRDRLRQAQLEDMGWKFHRIWSTDWFLRRQAEIESAFDSWKRAVSEYEEGEAYRQGDPLGGPFKTKDRDTGHTSPEPTREPAAARPRSPRPAVPRRIKIEDYYDQELIELVRWIKSDGLLRTDDQIIAEMTRELGFARRGTNIVDAIKWALGQLMDG